MWFKNELKFLIEPGYRECFYQHVERDTVFHASFQVTFFQFSCPIGCSIHLKTISKVIKGDGVGLEVIDPKGITLLALNNEPTGSHQIQTGENEGLHFDSFHCNNFIVFFISFSNRCLCDMYRQ